MMHMMHMMQMKEDASTALHLSPHSATHPDTFHQADTDTLTESF